MAYSPWATEPATEHASSVPSVAETNPRHLLQHPGTEKQRPTAQNGVETDWATQVQSEQPDFLSWKQKTAKEQDDIAYQGNEEPHIEMSLPNSPRLRTSSNEINKSGYCFPAYQPANGELVEDPTEKATEVQSGQPTSAIPNISPSMTGIDPESWTGPAGEYVSCLMFQSTAVPFRLTYRTLAGQGTFERHEDGEKKVKTNGRPTHKVWFGAGYHLTESFMRKNAVAKLIQWRDSVKEETRRQLRQRIHITLDLGPTDGPFGDPAIFADSIVTLRKRLRSQANWLPKADFLLKVAVPNDKFVFQQLARSGFLRYWDEVRTILSEFSDRFQVEVTDCSIKDATVREWWGNNEQQELERHFEKALGEIHAPVIAKDWHSNTEAARLEGHDAMLSHFGFTESSLREWIKTDMKRKLEGRDPSDLHIDDKQLEKRVAAEICKFQAKRQEEIKAKCAEMVATPESVETAIRLAKEFVNDLEVYQKHGKFSKKTRDLPESSPSTPVVTKSFPHVLKWGIRIPKVAKESTTSIKILWRKSRDVLVEEMERRGLPVHSFRTRLEFAAAIAAYDEGTFWSSYDGPSSEMTVENPDVPASDSIDQVPFTDMNVLADYGLPDRDILSNMGVLAGSHMQDHFDLPRPSASAPCGSNGMPTGIEASPTLALAPPGQSSGQTIPRMPSSSLSQMSAHPPEGSTSPESIHLNALRHGNDGKRSLSVYLNDESGPEDYIPRDAQHDAKRRG